VKLKFMQPIGARQVSIAKGQNHQPMIASHVQSACPCIFDLMGDESAQTRDDLRALTLVAARRFRYFPVSSDPCADPCASAINR